MRSIIKSTTIVNRLSTDFQPYQQSRAKTVLGRFDFVDISMNDDIMWLIFTVERALDEQKI